MNKKNKITTGAISEEQIWDSIETFAAVDGENSQLPPLDDLEHRRMINGALDKYESDILSNAVSTAEERKERQWGGVVAVAAVFFIGLGLVLITFMRQETQNPVLDKAIAKETQTLPPAKVVAVIGEDAETMGLKKISRGLRFHTGDFAIGLSLGEQKVVFIGPNSELIIDSPSPNLDAVFLEKGSILASVAQKSDEPVMTVRTFQGTVVVTGTIFGVSAQAEQVSVELFKGEVRLERSSGVDRTLHAGQMTAFNRAEIYQIADDRLQSAMDTSKSLHDAVDLNEVAINPAYSFDFDMPVIQVGLVDGGVRIDPKVANTKRSLLSAKQLLKQAQKYRRAKKWKKAEITYKQLLANYPKSSAGQVALVSIGSIYLNKLSRPSSALMYFNKYLKSQQSGTLRSEAAWGKSEALRKLGRTAAERRALEKFVAEFPRAFQVDRAQKRLLELAE